MIAIVLAENLDMYADSTSVYKLLDLDIPELEGLMPHVDKVWVESLVTNVSQNEIDWNIDASVGFNAQHESVRSFFATDLSAVNSNRDDASNYTSSYYRRHTRLTIKWRLHTGIASPRQGRLSAVMYLQLLGR